MRVSTNQLAVAIMTIAAVGFVIGSTLVIYQYDLWTGSTDIYPTWQGAQLFWEDGISPYDDRVGLESQRAIYADQRADEGEDEFQFVYPFYMILYIGPLPFLEFEIAATIFMELLLLLFGTTLVLSLDTMQWLPSPPTLGIAILIFLTAYFTVRGLLLSQPAILAYGFHIAAYWGISRKHDRFAGVMLALSTIKPQTGYLIVPLLLIWAWFNHRRSIAYAFSAMFALLFLGSMVLLPTWFPEWMDRVFNYRAYTETIATAQIITHAIDAIPDVIQFMMQYTLSFIVLIPVALFWRRSILQQDDSNFLWGIMLTMTASLIVAPRTATTYYIELYPAILVALFLLEKRKQTALIIGGSIFFVVSYWVLHIVTAPPVEDAGREAPIVYVVFPVLMYGWLLLQRDAWKQIDMLNRQEQPA